MVLSKGYKYTKIGLELCKAFLIGDTTTKKRKAELAYWKMQQAKGGQLSSDHYEHFFTEHFNLQREYYDGKTILDIGCGPRGSLDWATMADQCIGLDPLVEEYKKLGIDNSTMEYINGQAEEIPFPDDQFDVVTSFNSLDHVDDLDKSISEIKRVVKPGGLFLLITDVNHDPTVTEPISYEWDIVEEFSPEFELVSREQNEKTEDNIYLSARYGEGYDFSDNTDRYGVLSAKFKK